MKDISKTLSKAIKEHKWVFIEYENTNKELTKFWISIQDINIHSRSFKADLFNVTKIENSKKGLLRNVDISFDNIKSATLLEHTTYDQNIDLINKIEKNIDLLGWLNFDSYQNNTLDYLLECIKHESTSYQEETSLISGIDIDTFEKSMYRKDSNDNKSLEKYYELSIKQIGELTEQIEKIGNMYKNNKYKNITLAINLLSINTKQGLFVIAYKELNFNPALRSLVLDDFVKFNYEFASDAKETYKHNLKNYLDIEVDEFTKLFKTDRRKAINMLSKELPRFSEKIDERPYIMDLVRFNNAAAEGELNAIKYKASKNELNTPLKAFFGNMNKSLISRRWSVHVVVLNDYLNIDQLRLIYNALTQPITYVQGPPGTGKTQSILNLLISAFFNDEKVLLSSNNNKPIDDIYNKIMDLENDYGKIPLPFLRLGNNDKTLESLDYIKDILDNYSSYEVKNQQLEAHELSNKERVSLINKAIESYEIQLELKEEYDALDALSKNVNNFRTSIILDAELEKKKIILDGYEQFDEEDIIKLITQVDEQFLTWLFFTSIKHYKRIYEPKNKELLSIITTGTDEERVTRFNKYISYDENLYNLQRIFPIILTTNQSAHKLGSQKEHFDLAILDEAGQCSIGPSLYVISRAKRLLLVGDQNQLRPVVSIAPETNNVLLKKYNVNPVYSYTDNSILITMQQLDTISKFVLLRYHYRSHEDIINFSNQKYYNNRLVLPNKGKYKGNALHYINVDSGTVGRANTRNTSILEVEKMIHYIKENNIKNVGIITPFRNQANLINDILKSENMKHVDAGTIHTFQGDEKDYIFLSLGITKYSGEGTFDWLKDNQELINVATTRAKKKFILVGDLKEVISRSANDKTNDLYELSEYVYRNGKDMELTPNNKYNFVNGANYKQFNTKVEQEFFKTINHLLSLNNKYKVSHNVRVASIFREFSSDNLFEYGLKAEFDLVIFKVVQNNKIPILVIELDGDEHLYDEKVKQRDQLKEQICIDNNIKILRIRNDYSRRYMLIKDMLIDLLE